MNKLAVIAFGGNALLKAGEKGTFDEQVHNVEEAARALIPLVREGYDIVIGHGNGPQVGNALLRHEAGARDFGLPAMPMDYCGAETQGGIAYLLETGIGRSLGKAGIKKNIVSLVTRVEVSADDPAFRNPTKFVGPYYEVMPEDGAVYRQDPRGLGWRKVVPSPEPLRIHNIGVVEKLAREGNIVITVGGGGIPVMNGRGIEAVIDKDLASALAAAVMTADELRILTDVPRVCVNFRKPGERQLDVLTLADARKYLEEGQFAAGSMGPKVKAAIRYVEATGGICYISETKIIP